MKKIDSDYDILIIGTGFGGSVSAMRLSQKGYKVAMLEAGRRYRAQDFPKSNWNVRKYLWAPLIRCFGFQKITALKGLMVLHGVGVGGGSLVYANTLMQPEPPVFKDKGWPGHRDWQTELTPYYEEARRMLGVARNPLLAEADQALLKVAERMGAEETFHATDVGVYFGSKPGEKATDPYFSGAGPERTGCNFCGGCMVGCRFRSKNTLDYNYLYFAEQWGTVVVPETRATRIIPDGDGYIVETRSTTNWLKPKRLFRAKKVIVSAGVMGTLDLLLKNRDIHKTLPNLSQRLGDSVRTNGESLLGATSFDRSKNYSRGVAIGSAMHPDDVTKIEPVRYPPGSNFMRLLAVPLTGDGTWLTRPLKMVVTGIKRFHRFVRLSLIKDWAHGTVILLVMQSIDQRMRLRARRGLLAKLGLSLKAEHENMVSSNYIPKAQVAAQHLAEIIDGEPQNVVSEVLFQTPATAHVLGGCRMSDNPEEGVINDQHEVFGYPGLYVCDGSVIPVNLAVNPSLTITALAERFTNLWPVNAAVRSEDLKARVIHYGHAP